MRETCHYCSQHHEIEQLEEMVGFFRGKTAVVTGATGGIGSAVVSMFRRRGAEVLGLSRIDGDLSELFGVERVARVVRDAKPSILVNCAGASTLLHYNELDIASLSWSRAFNLHTVAPFELSRAAWDAMKLARWGRILNISTTAVKRPSSRGLPYACSKAAMEVLTARFAQDLAPYNVLVNTIRLGPMDTAMRDQEGREDRRRLIPLGRYGTPKEAADLVGYLASYGDWITGQTFTLSGGE